MSKKLASTPICDGNGKPMLKMRELTEATGVKKPTILFYIKEGLLPKPVKTSPNVSFYPVSFIERVNLIRKLKDKHRLSLTRIKEILAKKDAGKEIAPLIEMHNTVFGHKDTISIQLEDFCQKTGLSPEQVKEATKAKLIIPLSSKSFDSEDLALGGFLKQVFNLGLSIKDISYYSKLGQKIIKEEMKIHERLVEDVSAEKAIELTLEITQIARVMRGYVMERLFQKHASRQQVIKDETGCR